MEKTASSQILLLLLITLSSFISPALCLAIHDPAAAAAPTNHLDISPATEDAAAGIDQSDPLWPRFRPRRPWPLVHPPIPAAGGFTWPPNRPWPHWEYASPPRPAGGYKWPPTEGWPRWSFVNPPMPARSGYTWPPNRPWPHWEFVQPPVAAGSHWPPVDWPHWRFVQPPMPSKPADETTAAAPAA